VATSEFIKDRTPDILKIYQKAIRECMRNPRPYFGHVKEEGGNNRLTFAIN